MLLSDVCLSRTLGLSREQRLRKTKIGTEIAHVTRDSDTTFKVKGQGHQATFLSAALLHKAAAGSALKRIGRGKVLLRCVWSAVHEALGRPWGRRGAGTYCVTMRTACYICCNQLIQ